MTALELRLLTLATLAATPAELVDVFSEPIKTYPVEGNLAAPGRLLTVELVTNGGTRTFGLHSRSLAAAEPLVVLRELRRQFAAPAGLPRPE